MSACADTKPHGELVPHGWGRSMIAMIHCWRLAHAGPWANTCTAAAGARWSSGRERLAAESFQLKVQAYVMAPGAMTMRWRDCVYAGTEDRRSSVGTRSTCDGRDVEKVSVNTNRIPTDYACRTWPSNSAIQPLRAGS